MDNNLVPEISVIMPVYNVQLYLKESIESILNQTFKNFELIIVNDASTDNSKNIINQFNDTRIVFIDNEVNKGASNSRNIAIEKARGEYIALMDADDISLPNRLETQYNYLKSHSEIAVVGSFYKIINQEFVSDNLPITANEVKLFALLYSPIANPTAFIKKEIIIKNKLLFNNECVPAEDFDLWTRILEQYKIENIPEVLLHYRLHDNQISTLFEAKKNDVVALIRKKQIEKLIDFSTKNYTSVFVIDVLLCEKTYHTLQNLKAIENVLEDIWDVNLMQNQYDKLLLQNKLKTTWHWHYSNLSAHSFKTISLLKDPYNYKQLTLKNKIKLIVKSIINWKG